MTGEPCHIHSEAECTCPAYLIAMRDNDEVLEEMESLGDAKE